MRTLAFPKPLLEGVITARPNRFLMKVDLGNGIEIDCHCPTTGKIFDIDFNHQSSPIMCLVSHYLDHEDNWKHSSTSKTKTTKKSTSSSKPRKTHYTVEAISLDANDRSNNNNHQYIGINQMKTNHYIEYFLAQNAFSSFLPITSSSLIEREVKLGQSKLDFRIDQSRFLEIKTPLSLGGLLKYPISPDIVFFGENPTAATAVKSETTVKKLKKSMPSSSATNNRLIKHVEELSSLLSITKQQVTVPATISMMPGPWEAYLCLVYMYDAYPFQPPVENVDMNIAHAVQEAERNGVRYYQINMSIQPSGIELLDYFPLNFL